jgi:hypothetical protein
MPDDLDHYEEFYTEKLWNLIPALYRQEDTDNYDAPGPLHELVHRIGIQCAIVRRSIDRLYEDASIETCDDWLLPYFADLLGTRLVGAMDARGQRVDVARTINYRRRKGTLALVEELVHDVTGWEARAVEFFRRLGRTRHQLDPSIGPWAPPGSDTGRLQRASGLIGRWTRTATGGHADLRNVYGASKAGSAFDEFSYSADVRRPRGTQGCFLIPRLGIFLWRLKSFGVAWCDPIGVRNCPGHFTFDPTGRELPLFIGSTDARAFGDAWVSPEEWQLPGRLDTPLLERALAAPDDMPLWAVTDSASGQTRLNSLGVARQPGPDVVAHPLAHTYARHDQAAGDPDALVVTAARGRFQYLSAPAQPVLSAYHYGFASAIGAGPYDRREPGRPPLPPADVPGGANALDLRLAAIAASDTIVLGDSRTYTPVRDVEVAEALRIHAGNQQRPLLRLPESAAWTLAGLPGATLLLDGVFVSGADIILDGEFDEVTIRCCTFDPGNWDASAAAPRPAVDGRALSACRLHIKGNVRSVVVDRSVLGPVILDPGATLTEIAFADSVIQAPGDGPALALPMGSVSMRRVTLLGAASIHRLDASDCILDDRVTVEDTQHGCLRFSAWAGGSVIPRPYESVMIDPHAFLFASRDFGQPEYAQLHAGADFAIRGGAPGRSISEGAEDGSEMGAFCREKVPAKARSLLVKLQEYLPLWQTPVLIYST